jgi:RNA polymerase sigma-70 factor (ECF subfamily)
MPQEGSVTGIEAAELDGSGAAGEPDEDLVTAVRPADVFALLYRRHHLSIFRFLRARTASDDEAADLTALVFERAFAGMGRYRPMGGGVIAWLFTIARNAALDAGRSKRRHRLIVEPVAASGMETEPREPIGLEDAVMKREQMADLRARVDRLPAVQRDAVVLRYAGGLTAREIAGVIGKSEAATQKLLSRALAVLRESYRDDS